MFYKQVFKFKCEHLNIDEAKMPLDGFAFLAETTCFCLMPVSKSEHSYNVKSLVGKKVVSTRGQKMLVGSFSANMCIVYGSQYQCQSWGTLVTRRCGCWAGVRGDTDSGDWRGQHCTGHTATRHNAKQEYSALSPSCSSPTVLHAPPHHTFTLILSCQDLWMKYPHRKNFLISSRDN